MVRGAAEKPRKAVTLKWFFGSRQLWPVAAACTCSGRELGIGASWDFPPRQWILAYQVMLYLPVQIKELPLRFWGLSGRVIEANAVMIPSWNHNGICTGKWNGNKNSCSLDFTQTGTCIKSWNMYYFLFCIFDCYRFFYKVLQHLFKLPNIFLSLCILRKTISILVLVILQLLWK